MQFNRKEKNYVQFTHNRTKRNYLERMSNHKIECMKVSKNYDYDYWDGDRKYGYGGYKYIKGYHSILAKKLIKVSTVLYKSVFISVFLTDSKNN